MESPEVAREFFNSLCHKVYGLPLDPPPDINQPTASERVFVSIELGSVHGDAAPYFLSEHVEDSRIRGRHFGRALGQLFTMKPEALALSCATVRVWSEDKAAQRRYLQARLHARQRQSRPGQSGAAPEPVPDLAEKVGELVSRLERGELPSVVPGNRIFRFHMRNNLQTALLLPGDELTVERIRMAAARAVAGQKDATLADCVVEEVETVGKVRKAKMDVAMFLGQARQKSELAELVQRLEKDRKEFFKEKVERPGTVKAVEEPAQGGAARKKKEEPAKPWSKKILILVAIFVLFVLWSKINSEHFNLEYEDFIKNYYILGVDVDAPFEVVSKRFRALSLELHPDKCKGDPDDCTRRYQEITEAYEQLKSVDNGRASVLSRPKTREEQFNMIQKQYDLWKEKQKQAQEDAQKKRHQEEFEEFAEL